MSRFILLLVALVCAHGAAAQTLQGSGGGGGGGSGTVTSVTASAPLTGGTITTTGSIGCSTAGSGTAGCVTPDTTSTHFLNGSGTWTTPAGSGGTVTSITATAPLSGGTITGSGSIGCTTAGSSTAGCVTPDGTSTHYLSGAGTWTAPSGGGSTTITLGTGLTNTNGTQSTGALTITNGSSVFPQLWPVAETTNHSATLADGAGIYVANAGSSITFTLPAATASTGADGSTGVSYCFGDESGHGFTLATTSSQTLYGYPGATGSATSFAFPASSTACASSDGTHWAVQAVLGVSTPLVGGTGLATITAHGVMLGEGTSNVATVSPGATSGVPLIAQGASSDPVYGTALPAGGGTGLATITAHGIMIGEGTSNVAPMAAGTAGQTVVSGGASADPVWAMPIEAAVWSVPTNVTVANGTTVVIADFPWTSGTINSISYQTAAGTFTAGVQIGGVNVTSCNAIAVSSSSNTKTTCTGANTLAAGNQVTVVISSASGSPNGADLQVTFSHTAN